MKKFTLLIAAILFVVTGIMAQTPNQFKYQAVLRDASGAIMTNQNVIVDVSILQGSASGTSVFTEQHNVTTTAQGLINLNIGSVSDLSTVDFSADTYYIEISVNSTIMGTSQLLSVPYALQAKNAENFSGTITESQISDFGNYLTNEVDSSVTNEIQNLSQVLTQNNSADNARIIDLADPEDTQDAATKAYVDILEARIYALENPPNTVNDIDGNTYNIINIGMQTWMLENLRVTHYADGSEIDTTKPAPAIYTDTEWGALGDNDTDKAYCFYNNNTYSSYGVLYTYAAATNGDNSGVGVQGVCPDGWHLPSDDEWKELEMHLGIWVTDADVIGYRGTDQGSQLAGNASLWTNGPLDSNANFGTSGFTALPGGIRSYSTGSFAGLKDRGIWWSATESDALNAYMRIISYDKSTIYHGTYRKSAGFSVRCLKD